MYFYSMLKQFIAIILLSIFNFILVGHSIIPHEHDEEHHHSHTNDHHHHHTFPHSEQHHKENDQKQSKGLSDFFASVIHISEFVPNENRNKGTEKIDLQDTYDHSELTFHLSTIFLSFNLKSIVLFYRDPDYSPPNNSHKGLRAPPVFFS